MVDREKEWHNNDDEAVDGDFQDNQPDDDDEAGGEGWDEWPDDDDDEIEEEVKVTGDQINQSLREFLSQDAFEMLKPDIIS